MKGVPGRLFDPADPPRQLWIGDLVLRTRLRRLVRPDGRAVDLEPKVVGVLLELAARPGEVVTRGELLERVWEGRLVTESVLSRAISTLRKSFGDRAVRKGYLETIRKTGYRLAVPVRLDGPAAPPAERPMKRSLDGVALVAVAVLAAAGGVWLSSRPRMGEDRFVPRPQPLTSFRGSELDPALSPDGQRIAYAWSGESATDFDIYVQPVDGGPPLRLTHQLGEDKNPAWSPDGRRLAFIRDAQRDPGIFSVSVPEGVERQLARTRTGDIPDLVWSEDGRFLYFPDQPPSGGPTAIVRLELATSSREWVSHPAAKSLGDRDLAVDPSGERIAFARAELPGVEDLWVATVSTGEETRLTWDRQPITGIEWLPESDELLFSSTRDGLSRFWRIPADGGEPTPETALGENGFDPSYSVGTHRLVFERKVYDTNVWRVPLRAPGDPEVWIESTRNDSAPAVSPKGDRLAFLSDRSGPMEIWVQELAGRGEAEQVSRLAPARPGPPAWTPDGGALVFSLRASGQSDLARLGLEGAQLEPLTETPWQEEWPSVSRDGRFVFFGSDRSGAWEIWKMPLEGGEAIQLTRQGGLRAVEGADGSLYFSRLGQPGLGVLLPGGVHRPFFVPGAGAVGLDWTVGWDELYVRVLTPDPTAVRALLELDARTGEKIGEVARLTHIGLYGLGVSASPDGGFLYFGRADRTDGDIVRVDGYR